MTALKDSMSRFRALQSSHSCCCCGRSVTRPVKTGGDPNLASKSLMKLSMSIEGRQDCGKRTARRPVQPPEPLGQGDLVELREPPQLDPVCPVPAPDHTLATLLRGRLQPAQQILLPLHLHVSS